MVRSLLGATVRLPNLVLVCDSNIGSCTLTATAATMPERMSAYS